MGAGDEFMATAQVKGLFSKIQQPVMVVDRFGRIRSHALFENNPKISLKPRTGLRRLINGPGVRPYILGRTAKAFQWRRWDIQPGEIFLSAAERAFAAPHAGYVVIEPTTKAVDSNKAWIWDRWQELADRHDCEFVQLGPLGTRELRGVRRVVTPTFREACAVLAVSKAFVGVEGGLHHAAAALGRQATVLFSEFIGPAITGYPNHRNIWKASRMCGARYRCETCRQSMERITVDEVQQNLQEILK